MLKIEPNSNEILKRKVTNDGVISFYKLVCYLYTKNYIQAFITNIQILITKVGILFNSILTTSKKVSYCFEALKLLCLDALNDKNLFMEFEKLDINGKGNKGKHDIVANKIDINQCVEAYNSMLSKLVSRYSLDSLKMLVIKKNIQATGMTMQGSGRMVDNEYFGSYFMSKTQEYNPIYKKFKLYREPRARLYYLGFESNGPFNGYGLFEFENGDYAFGKFHNSAPNGFCCECVNRILRIGKFADGVMDGLCFICKDNNIRFGLHTNDVAEGANFRFFENGDWFFSWYKNGTAEGTGYLYTRNQHSISKVIFKEGMVENSFVLYKMMHFNHSVKSLYEESINRKISNLFFADWFKDKNNGFYRWYCKNGLEFRQYNDLKRIQIDFNDTESNLFMGMGCDLDDGSIAVTNFKENVSTICFNEKGLCAHIGYNFYKNNQCPTGVSFIISLHNYGIVFNHDENYGLVFNADGSVLKIRNLRTDYYLNEHYFSSDY